VTGNLNVVAIPQGAARFFMDLQCDPDVPCPSTGETNGSEPDQSRGQTYFKIPPDESHLEGEDCYKGLFHKGRSRWLRHTWNSPTLWTATAIAMIPPSLCEGHGDIMQGAYNLEAAAQLLGRFGVGALQTGALRVTEGKNGADVTEKTLSRGGVLFRGGKEYKFFSQLPHGHPLRLYLQVKPIKGCSPSLSGVVMMLDFRGNLICACHVEGVAVVPGITPGKIPMLTTKPIPG